MSKLAKALTAAAGNAGESLYVEDVFSTYLYTGNGSTQTITNGIDLDGEGGMVWKKQREAVSGGFSHNVLADTERGAANAIFSDLTDPQYSLNPITSFNSDGFSVTDNNSAGLNLSGKKYASWTFRKAEKFFDVVTYTGNSTAGRTVSHNLGSVPAVIIVKKTSSSSSSNWYVYHSSLGSSAHILLNTTAAADTASSGWNNTNPTATEFTLGNNVNVNANGESFVAYLFASDAGGFGDDGSESIIKCGSFTGTVSTLASVNLGFEPQFIIIKATNASGGDADNWRMHDDMRGWNVVSRELLNPNTSAAESAVSNTGGYDLIPTATGFDHKGHDYTNPDTTYIYIAIRRPMKTPESGTEVFGISEGGTTSPGFISSFPIDAAIGVGTEASNRYFSSRLTDQRYMLTTSTAAEATNSYFSYAFQNGYYDSTSGATELAYMFKRATGFFDVVAYTGDGVAGSTQAHNLGVVPECMIVKRRDGASSWITYWDALGATKGQFLDNNQAFTSSSYWNDTAPTATQLTLGSGSTNNSGATFIAYLFATLAGVSKVGSYTGTGSNVDVDCGFSAGARFILIKRTDSTGDWYVYDSERGIVAGNDPYLLLNSTAAEVTGTDYIDPLSSGFTVTSSAPAALNASGGTYIFLAIS
jgi:hypothetical protein